ncbi:Na-translocating system protein MpsC family protein [Ornithinibacillus halophilus]|uniref:Uncharacterized protein YbcI n=1 Tax=Ornithinibacillus halophilus TaxID=930117 RepID=A0A1M5FNW2_9BACI|nr:Na-translocating system protein MpsC family protein [Ornithinibacillus halophilus]SHF93124.1 Uncharacterized protein YbcI [Ornithinibacillus halophilus]
MAVISSDTRLLKKNVAQVYNKINQKFYATGVVSQRISVYNERIIIFAQHKRVPAFKALSKNFNELTTFADAALIKEFKVELKQEIQEVTGYKVISVLKDYDAETEHACCIIIFDRKIVD